MTDPFGEEPPVTATSAPAGLEHDVRPWGEYFVLADEPTYKVKRIVVKPGQRLSLQLHHQRSEHWFMVQGTGAVTLGDEVHLLSAGESIDIAMGTPHRMENHGAEDVVFVEVQHGTYFGEDDIVRLADDYGRTS